MYLHILASCFIDAGPAAIKMLHDCTVKATIPPENIPIFELMEKL